MNRLKYSHIIFWLAAGILLLINLNRCYGQKQIPVIIDADTGNEVDDLYAIVRGLLEPAWNVLGLNSCQWQASHWATPKTLEDSHRQNVLLLAYLNRMDLPHPRGAYYRLYDWGQDRAQHSAAAYHIINERRQFLSFSSFGWDGLPVRRKKSQRNRKNSLLSLKTWA